MPGGRGTSFMNAATRIFPRQESPVRLEDKAGAVLTIDVAAIRENYELLRRRLGATACAAVVKADAYGLGARIVGAALAKRGCRRFFVAHLDEGIGLRPHLPADAEIYILNGLPPGAEAECAAAGLLPVLNSLEQIDAWAALAKRRGRALPAALQVDTGMSRLGLAPHDVDRLAEDFGRLQGVAVKLVMSHLACADEPEHPANREQLAAFRELRDRLPPAPASLANSAGVFLGAAYHFDLARPGAALYGLAPIADAANPMRPVIRLEAKVIQVRSIGRGTSIGYGCSFRAAAPMRVATLSVGYADGWLRSLSNRGCVHFGGVALPIVGRVSMDSLTVDVTQLAPTALHAGSMVELIGERQSVDDVARAAGTIGYEILTSLGARYHRVYVGR